MKRYSLFCCSSMWGGASADLGLTGWKPTNENVRTRFGRSRRSLRMHRTTPSHSSFSSANSSSEMNECFEASCDIVDGRFTYSMLSSGLKIVSQELNFCAVTNSFSVTWVGAGCDSTSWMTAASCWFMKSTVDSVKSRSVYSDEAVVVESIDVLRLYSFKGDALSWSVLGVGTSGPPQRSYSQGNTVGVEARRRGGGAGRRRRNRAFTGTITTTHWLTSRDRLLLRRFHYTDDINHFGSHKLHHLVVPFVADCKIYV